MFGIRFVLSTFIKKYIMRIAVIVLVSLLFSCKASEKENLVGAQEIKKETLAKTSPIEFTEIKSGENAKYKKAKNKIITTQEEMDIAWVKMFEKYDRKPPIPMVDFEMNQLLLVTMGEKPSGGYSVKVSSIAKTPKGMLVTIEEFMPGKSCNNTSALVYPFQLIEMAKTTEVLTYVRVSKINECEE